ncbi:MAG: hypothetical protein LH478_14230 [Chitinophagaceae bacterium]|nr:hypothetical protein [Chitinophagaceae bacterium]
MLIAPDEIKKLSVVERAQLFLALKSDQEMKAYLHSEKGDEFLMEAITKRDQAYIKGEIKLTSIEDDF